jgi:CheY-like chemotaxis protein
VADGTGMHDADGGANEPSRRILYIEDNAANMRLVERVFERRADIEMLTATRGQDGLELARTRQPEVVLLDLHLPDLDGDEVLRLLRADPITQSIPVVILSADANDRQIQRLLEAGAAAYLTKPLDIHTLVATVDEMLPRRSPAPIN